ncbi:hypothetical protein ACOSP7_025269 [Xanthoceras sorbifolium]
MPLEMTTIPSQAGYLADPRPDGSGNSQIYATRRSFEERGRDLGIRLGIQMTDQVIMHSCILDAFWTPLLTSKGKRINNKIVFKPICMVSEGVMNTDTDHVIEPKLIGSDLALELKTIELNLDML